MKNLSKNQWIAVFVGLVLLGYLLYAGPIMNFLNSPMEDSSVEMLETGFVVQEVTVGTGPAALPGDILTVHYIGTLEDGKVFDSSVDRGTPITFNLGTGEVIRGWDEGLVGMRIGGKRILIIASDYGYGNQGVGAIPPNSTLFFEVELLDVEKP